MAKNIALDFIGDVAEYTANKLGVSTDSINKLFSNNYSHTKLYMSHVPQAAIVLLNRSGDPITTNNDAVVRFQVPPRSIQDGKNANYEQQNILGRSEPLRAYTGSSPRMITFELEYYWFDYNMYSNGGWGFIKENLDKLKSVAYPAHSDKNIAGFGYQPPPKVLFFFGKIYNGIPCIIKAVNITYNSPWVNPTRDHYVNNGQVVPFETRAQIQLEVAYDYDDVRGSEQIRGGFDYKGGSSKYSHLFNTALDIGKRTIRSVIK